MSCDACGKGSFSGKRYKCLVCYDFDLCADCYEAGETGTGKHTIQHPMQCILTRVESGRYSFLCSYRLYSESWYVSVHMYLLMCDIRENVSWTEVSLD